MTRKADSTIAADATKPVSSGSRHPGGPGKSMARRGGGPMTIEGKRKASLNATKHGILAQSPIVGDETAEEWHEHLAGMRDSWQPVGHFEELLTVEGAMNRWKRARVERSTCGSIQSQIDLVSEPTLDTLETVWDGRIQGVCATSSANFSNGVM